MYRIVACVSRRVARDVVRNFNISIFQVAVNALPGLNIYRCCRRDLSRRKRKKNILYKEMCAGVTMRPAGGPGVCAEKRPEVARRYIPADGVISPCNSILRIGGCAEVNTGLPDNLLICGEVCGS